MPRLYFPVEAHVMSLLHKKLGLLKLAEIQQFTNQIIYGDLKVQN